MKTLMEMKRKTIARFYGSAVIMVIFIIMDAFGLFEDNYEFFKFIKYPLPLIVFAVMSGSIYALKRLNDDISDTTKELKWLSVQSTNLTHILSDLKNEMQYGSNRIYDTPVKIHYTPENFLPARTLSEEITCTELALDSIASLISINKDYLGGR